MSRVEHDGSIIQRVIDDTIACPDLAGRAPAQTSVLARSFANPDYS
jgi:hypothetical protein